MQLTGGVARMPQIEDLRNLTSLETQRLVLSPHTPADFPEVAAMWRDPEVTRFIGGRPFTDEESWTRLLRYVGHWAALGFGYWTLRERESGRFVGEVGFADYRREIEPGFVGAPEIGWALAPWAWGRGYATEAVEAALAWGDACFGESRTVCIISPENAASIAIALKCGYAPAGMALYRGAEIQVYARPGATARSRSVSARRGLSPAP
jgi:RimJ/RimL family protein N-acetyltransferase